MRLTDTQRAVLRLGAVLCLVAVVPLALVALLVDSEPASGRELTTVIDPTTIALPDHGVLGGSVTVYGHTDGRGVPPADLGCVLLSDNGSELNQAKLSHLAVRLDGTPGVTVDGETLQPLFEVKNYPDGATLACSDAASVAPVAVSEPSTFGGAALAVRLLAGGTAVLCLVLGALGLLLVRPARR